MTAPTPSLTIVGTDHHPSTLVIDVPANTPPEVWQLVEQFGATLEELFATMTEQTSTAPATVPSQSASPRTAAGTNGVDPHGASIDRRARRVFRDREEVHLTHLEFEVLVYFLDNPSRAINRDELLENVWRQPSFFGSSRTVDVHIRRLRRKLGSHLRLTTMRGFGYRLDGFDAAIRPITDVG